MVLDLIFNKEILFETDLKVSNINSQEYLFPEVGQNLILRPLSLDDYKKGYLNVLQQLTAVGEVTEELFMQRFNSMKKCPETYYILVIEDTSNNIIVGTATLVIEQKFIHNCSVRGRIEDVVVHNNYRGKELGKTLVSTLASLAEKLNCYKVSLECKDNMIPFYENFDFKKEPNNSNYMQKRFQD